MTIERFKQAGIGIIICTKFTYAAAHDAASGTSQGTTAAHRAMNSYGWLAGRYTVVRGFLQFPTSGLPDGAIITSARILFDKALSALEQDSGQGVMHVVEGVQSDPVVLSDFGLHKDKITSYGSKSNVLMGASEFYIDLDAAGMALINKTGVTKFCLRLAGDKDNIAPTGKNDASFGHYTSARARSTTMPATETGKEQATLNGIFNDVFPCMLAVTYTGVAAALPQVRFQYGLTTSYGTNTAWQIGLDGGDSFLQLVTGLAARALYHFRTHTNNAAGDHYGSDETFRTTRYLGDVHIDQLKYQHAERMEQFV